MTHRTVHDKQNEENEDETLAKYEYALRNCAPEA